MSNKKTPSNKRILDLNSTKIRRIILVQSLQIKSLQRENQHLRNRVKLAEGTLNGPYKFFYKLAYACEVILNIVKSPFRRKE